jgi:DNA repair exonuclease SbcCD nuclease subunit
MDRTTVRYGKEPIILIAPHGAEEPNTAFIAEKVAKNLNAYAVINNGFEKSLDVDVLKNQADCNKVTHCESEVVYEEYLKYYERFVELIHHKHITRNPDQFIRVYHLHGFNHDLEMIKNRKIDVIVGSGDHRMYPNLTCEKAFAQRFMNLCLHDGMYTFHGIDTFSGRHSNNMNQYFRMHKKVRAVQSIQVQLSPRHLVDTLSATVFALSLEKIIGDMIPYPLSVIEEQVPII